MSTNHSQGICLINVGCHFWQKAGKVMPWLQSAFLFGVRLFWGYGFIQTGLGKLRHLDKIIAFFDSLGIPFASIQAPFVGCLEFFGGILIVLGLGTRVVAVPLAGTLVVAYMTAHREELAMIFQDPEPFMSAAPFLFLFAMVILILFGPGYFSLDKMMSRKLRKKYSRD